MEEDLRKIKEAGLYRSLRRLSSAQGPEIMIDGRKVLNFCSNNYLGLAEDPRVVQGAIQAAQKYGAGSGAARLISGNFDLYEELESGLARFKGTEAALLFNSGYHANIGVIPSLAGEGDVIFSDELNHASLIDGCRLSKAETVIYRHNDLNHLEDLLQCRGTKFCAPTKTWIITEAVFSMEGDLCPLPDLITLAEKYDAHIYLDEAHAVGVFGDKGEGLAKCTRYAANHLICMGTLGKAFGSYGAFVVGSQTLKEFLINRARSFIFTTGLPPAAVGASLAALKIIRDEPGRRKQLWENIGILSGRVLSLRKGFSGGLNRRQKPLLVPPDLQVTGPDLVGHVSPIFSLQIGPADKTMVISQKFLEEGIYLQGIRPPTVPEGTSRLRLTVMATHTMEQLDRLVERLKSERALAGTDLFGPAKRSER